MVEALNASYTFANSLKKNDWVAVISYDMKPHILADFTQDKQAVYGALNQLRIPGFAETNLFDALYDTLDRVTRSRGTNTSSWSPLESIPSVSSTSTRLRRKSSPRMTSPFFPISVGLAVREYCEVIGARGYTHGMGIPVGNMDYLQADNEMNTFARLTGGRAYFPRFQARTVRKSFTTSPATSGINTTCPITRPTPSWTAPIAN